MLTFRRGNAAVALTVATMLAMPGFATPTRAQATPPQSTPPQPACSAGTTVQTAAGPVCGLTADGQTSYLDIPYAAPPLGGLR